MVDQPSDIVPAQALTTQPAAPAPADMFVADADDRFFSTMAVSQFGQSVAIAEQVLQQLGDEQPATLLPHLWMLRLAYSRGIVRFLARDYVGSAQDFDTAASIAQQLIAADVEKDYPGFEPSAGDLTAVTFGQYAAPIRAALARASESAMRGSGTEVLRHLDTAEMKADLFLDAAEGDDSRRMMAAIHYLGFVSDAAVMYLGVMNVDADAAIEFFDRNKAKVEAIRALAAQTENGDAVAMTNLLTKLIEPFELVARSRAAVTAEKYDDALKGYDEARRMFRELARTFPENLPMAAQLREVCLNVATVAIPQLKAQAQRDSELMSRIRFLEEGNVQKAAELRASLESKDQILLRLVSPIQNLTIENNANIETNIQNSLSVAVDVQNRGIDAVLAALEEIKGAVGDEDQKAVRAKAAEAVEEHDLKKKIEKVAGVIEAFGKIADTVADVVPYGRIAYRVLRGVFA